MAGNGLAGWRGVGASWASLAVIDVYAVLVAVELGVSSWVSAQLLNIEMRNR